MKLSLKRIIAIALILGSGAAGANPAAVAAIAASNAALAASTAARAAQSAGTMRRLANETMCQHVADSLITNHPEALVDGTREDDLRDTLLMNCEGAAALAREGMGDDEFESTVGNGPIQEAPFQVQRLAQQAQRMGYYGAKQAK